MPLKETQSDTACLSAVCDIAHLLLLLLRVCCHLSAVYAHEARAQPGTGASAGAGASDFGGLAQRVARERNLSSGLEVLGSALESYLCATDVGGDSGYGGRRGELAALGLTLSLSTPPLPPLSPGADAGVDPDIAGGGDDWDDWGDDGEAQSGGGGGNGGGGGDVELRSCVKAALIRAIGAAREAGMLTRAPAMVGICANITNSGGGGGGSGGGGGGGRSIPGPVGLVARLVLLLGLGYEPAPTPATPLPPHLPVPLAHDNELLCALRPAHGNAFAQLASVVGTGLGILAQGLAGGLGSFLSASAPDPAAPALSDPASAGRGGDELTRAHGEQQVLVLFVLGGLSLSELAECQRAIAHTAATGGRCKFRRIVLVTTDVVAAADMYRQLFRTTCR